MNVEDTLLKIKEDDDDVARLWDGLSELSRLLGSWKSQQEEYREALGNYVMRCRETEEQFCERCAGIEVDR